MILDRLKIFLGTRCLICHEKTSLLKENILCFECYRNTFIPAQDRCFTCGIPTSSKSCRPCIQSPLIPGGLKIMYEWTPELDTLIKIYKYHYNFRVLKLFDRLSFDHLDFITTLPSSKNRNMQRGFDHAYFMAESILGNEKLVNLFEVEKSLKAQANLDPIKRWSNAKKAYHSKYDLSSTNKILIFDDLITTGSSLFFACRAIKSAEVQCLALTTSLNYDLKRRELLAEKIAKLKPC